MATYLNGFGTFFNSPAPRAGRSGRADYDRDGDVLARVLRWAWPGWGGVRNVLPVRTPESFVASPYFGVPIAADFLFSLLVLGTWFFLLAFMIQGFSFPHDIAGLQLSSPPNHQEAWLNWPLSFL